MKHKYGEFSKEQIECNAKIMHGQIHKLLLHKDTDFKNIVFFTEADFNNYFVNLLYRFGGLNELLGYPKHMVSLMSTLQAAYTEVNSENFNYSNFRRLILDAHGYVKLMFEEV